MIQSPENIGRYIRKVRKELNVTQKDLALTAGTGLRFIIDLENGKPTCQIGNAASTTSTWDSTQLISY